MSNQPMPRCRLYVLICLSVCVGLFTITMPISKYRKEQLNKKNAMLFSMQGHCRPMPRNCELHKTIKNQSMTNAIL